MYHPMTKEKQFLNKLAFQIREMKNDIEYGTLMNGVGIANINIPAMQKQLAKKRYIFRHRHIAYCLVRGKTMSMIESNPARKVNLKLMNMFRIRLLSAIKNAYAEFVDQLLKEKHTNYASHYVECKTACEECEEIKCHNEVPDDFPPEAWTPLTIAEFEEEEKEVPVVPTIDAIGDELNVVLEKLGILKNIAIENGEPIITAEQKQPSLGDILRKALKENEDEPIDLVDEICHSCLCDVCTGVCLCKKCIEFGCDECSESHDICDMGCPPDCIHGVERTA